MPDLHTARPHLGPHAPEVKEFVRSTLGGPIASRMIQNVHWCSDHASMVLRSAPVLFWLFKDYEATDIAAIIEDCGSAKAVLREEFGLPKAMLRILSPWPTEHVRQVTTFLKEFDPAMLSNALNGDRMEQWSMLTVFGRFASHGGNVTEEQWDKLHRFVLENWRAIMGTGDARHACDYLWNNCDDLPRRINAKNLKRQVDAWDIELRKARVYGSTEAFEVLAPYPKGVIANDRVFTLLDCEIDLRAEGNDMSHCVGSYIAQVRSGRSIIYHMDGPDGERATLELSPRREGHIVNQNRGPHNAKIGKDTALAGTLVCQLVNGTVKRKAYA